MIHIYTGNGKGKTTSAIGLAIRALGHSKKVCLIQFMKKNFVYGEIQFLKNIPNIDIYQFGTVELVDINNPADIDFVEAQNGLEKAKQVLSDANYDLVILDELNVVLYFRLLKIEQVIDIIKNANKGLELVITGRYANEKLLALADLITEMKEVRHYYKKGIKARKGIEF